MGNICSKTPEKEKPLPRCDGRTTNGFWSSTAHATIGTVVGWFSSSAAEKFDKAVGYDKDIQGWFGGLFKSIFGFSWDDVKYYVTIAVIAIGVIIGFVLFGEFLMPLIPYFMDVMEMFLKLLLYLLGFIWRMILTIIKTLTSSAFEIGEGTPDWMLPLFIGIAMVSFFGLYFTDAGQRGLGGMVFSIIGCDIGRDPQDHSGKDNNLVQKFGHLISSVVRYIFAFFGYFFNFVSQDIGKWLTSLGVYFADINDFLWGYRKDLKCVKVNLQGGEGDVGDKTSAPTCREFD